MTRPSNEAAGRYDKIIASAVRELELADRPVNKIPLIKDLRDKTSLGLKDAKDAVEDYAIRSGLEFSEPRANPAVVVVILALLLAAGIGLAAALVRRPVPPAASAPVQLTPPPPVSAPPSPPPAP